MSMKRYIVQYTASKTASKIFQELKERDCDNLNFADLLDEIERDRTKPYIAADSVFKDAIKVELERSALTLEQRDRYREVYIKPLEDSIQITILDDRISGEQCDALAKEVAAQLSFAITGREIEEIKILNVVSINVCSNCNRVVRGLGYLCSECGQIYCFEHVQPEKHNCTEKKEEKEIAVISKEKCG
ncbi:MAG: AN1-type zinc finger protein [Halobacteria archaeon]